MSTPVKADIVIRAIAAILAIGGSYWGWMLLEAYGLAALFPIPFGVGYVVTTGYLIRATTVLKLNHRRMIWLASLLVQGTWLMFGLLLLTDGSWAGARLGWWGFAVACSVVGLSMERQAEPLATA